VKTAAAGKSDAHTPLPEPLDITFSDGLFNYHDETTATAFALREMVGSFEIDEQNEIFFQSSATLNEQRVHFSGNLKSLPRALGDGSPLDLNMEGAGASFGFSGRVAARQSLELAGTGSIDTQDSARLFKWFGFDLHGLRDKNSLWVESAVDSNGPLFLLKNAVIHFGKANAKGDVSYSGAGAKPRVTLSVDVDRLDLNSYTINPKKSAAAQNWNENIFDLHDLNAVDLQFRVTANQLLYEKFQIPTTQVEGQLNDGVLNAHISGVQFGKIELNFDAKQTPPKLDLILALEHSEAGTFLSSIAGMNWLSGNMQLNASLSAKGTSQAEMMGNLAGTADVQGESFAIHGADLAGLATRALAEPVSGWGSGDSGPVTAKAKFSISDGIATVSENSLSGASIKLSQTGEIDILRKALNLEAVVGLNGADHKNNKVEISGPWANPRFSVAQ